MVRIEEPAFGRGRVADQQATGARAGKNPIGGSEYLPADAGRFVYDEQQVAGVEPLKLIRLVGREPACVPLRPQLQALRQAAPFELRSLDTIPNLAPEDLADLAGGGSGRDDDTVRAGVEKRDRNSGGNEALADPVTASDTRSRVHLD